MATVLLRSPPHVFDQSRCEYVRLTVRLTLQTKNDWVDLYRNRIVNPQLKAVPACWAPMLFNEKGELECFPAPSKKISTGRIRDAIRKKEIYEATLEEKF